MQKISFDEVEFRSPLTRYLIATNEPVFPYERTRFTAKGVTYAPNPHGWLRFFCEELKKSVVILFVFNPGCSIYLLDDQD